MKVKYYSFRGVFFSKGTRMMRICIVCKNNFSFSRKLQKCCSPDCSQEYKKNWTQYLTEEEKKARAQKACLAYKEKTKNLPKKRQSYTLPQVRDVFSKQGYTLLSTDYKNNKQKLEVRCPQGHLFYPSLHNFKDIGNRCSFCTDPENNNVITTIHGLFKKQCKFCQTSFLTNLPHKKTCGKDECDRNRRSEICRRVENKRLGQRAEDKVLYYQKNKE